MSTVIHQPSDKFFRLSMGEIKVASEFFAAHLPALLLQQIDLDTLQLQKNSFIDEAYKATEADVVYSVQLGESTVYLYLLCEHQSQVDDLLAFRLLVYTVRIIEMHLKQHPEKPLPLVYPMVIYTGDRPWTAALDIFPLFAEAEALARETLLKPYRLLDVNQINDNELKKLQLSGLVAFVLKYRKTRDFNAFLEQLMPWIRDIELHNASGAFLAKVVIQYVMDDIPTGKKDLLIQKSEFYLSEALRSEIMTIAQQFREEGMQQGMQQGIQQGMQQGMQQGEAALLIKLLKRRFGMIPSSCINSIQKADADTLLKWGERVFDAQKLDDIFEE